jgi:Gpi18-like mannosyltransferase
MPMPVLFFLSLIIRLFLVPLSGFKADISYWKWWGMSAAHDGISGPLVNTAYNYPSFYLYILKTTSHVYELLTGYNFKLNPHDNIFWNDSNFLYLFLIKLPYIFADLGIGFLIYKIVRLSLETTAGKKIIPLFAASLYLLNPVVIYNSSVWGQTDSMGSFFILLAFYGLMRNNLFLLSVFSAIALFMKTQTVVFLPFLFLGLYLNTKNVSNLIKGLWIFLGAVILINLPFLATGHMDRVFDIMYTSQLYFPYVSMNAYNLWWIFFGKISSSFWDQNLIANLVTFKTAGVLLFGFVYALAISILIHSRHQPPQKNPNQALAAGKVAGYTQSFILISLSFFMLLTQMHERYLFPLFVFFPLYLGILLHQSYSDRKFYFLLFALYCALTLASLLNLHQVMVMNYPDNTLPFLPNTFNEPLTKIIAVINFITLVVLVILFTREISLRIKSLLVVVFSLFLAILILPKLLISQKSPVSLSALKPIYQHQDYGSITFNRSLSNWWLVSLYYFFDKGIATHANSRIVYQLNGQYKTFTTNFGIDNDADTNASVYFKIIGDQKELFKSKKMGRLDFPGYVSIDISNVRNLELIVDDAGDGINSDHADWLEPMLYEKNY